MIPSLHWCTLRARVAAFSATIGSATRIQAVTPAHAAGTVDVVVHNPDGQSSTLSSGFLYNNPAPIVASVSPNSGPVARTSVSIMGTDFLAGAPLFDFVATSDKGRMQMKNGNKLTPELNAARSEEVSLGHGGPRTPRGKENSKHNALKHGICSSVTVLEGESRREYQSLLRGLWESLQPRGTLEEVLVKELVNILWRRRRVIRSEGAEIRHSTDFMEWDWQNRQQEEAEEIANPSLAEILEDNRGWIRKTQNPHVLERCLELLAELREEIENEGFNEERDVAMLQKIYGQRGSALRENLYDSYDMWVNTATVDEEERKRGGYATPEQCKQSVLCEIDTEIRRLKRYQKTRNSIEVDRMKLEVLRRGVPDSPSLDRLLRYEASLGRAFDRTLTQLERLQRMRLGQAVPSPVKVEQST